MQDETTRGLTLGVTGMTCGSCRRHVQRALARVPGVLEADVNLARATAFVRYDASKTSVAALEDAITRAGYGTGMAEPGSRRPPGGGCGCGC